MTKLRVPAGKATASLAHSITRPPGRMGKSTALGGLLRLHQTAGNRAVGTLIQAKLRVNEPGDVYEQEADRVADTVMRMPEPVGMASGLGKDMGSPPAQIASRIQRLCPECEEDMQREVAEEDGDETLQAKPADSGGQTVSPGVENQIGDLPGSGQPLPEAARGFFEPRFGYDFGRVRVHADARAAGVARAVNARAFTVGSDVVFGEGEYAPGTEDGLRLLAHELTHVVQCNSAEGVVQRQTAAGGKEATLPAVGGLQYKWSTGQPSEEVAQADAFWKQWGPDIQNLKKTWDGEFFYGCYCGSGDKEKDKKKLGEQCPSDNIDKACQIHDKDYDGLKIDSSPFKAGKTWMFSPLGFVLSIPADTKIIANMIATYVDSTDYSLKGELTRRLAILIFSHRIRIALAILSNPVGLTATFAQLISRWILSGSSKAEVPRQDSQSGKIYTGELSDVPPVSPATNVPARYEWAPATGKSQQPYQYQWAPATPAPGPGR